MRNIIIYILDLRSLFSFLGTISIFIILLLANGCASNDKSLRIMTYNIGFVAEGDDINQQEWADDEKRAKFLGKKIVDTMNDIDADVIVFNEAFNIEPQRELSKILCPYYPYYVRFIDEAWDDQHQDSGLMIFSRHKFADLSGLHQDYFSEDHLAFKGCVAEDEADEDNSAYWDDVGFILYPQMYCSGVDCLANKGVALARFHHKTAGDDFNIAFTHLQASYSDGDLEEFMEDRRGQMLKVKTLIDALPDWEKQRTFVAGDLNIDGKGCSYSGCTVSGVGDEWNKHFNADGFFSCGSGPCPHGAKRFVESWGFEMPDADLGRTYIGMSGSIFSNEKEGERLDYILHNVPSTRVMCLQHAKVLYDFADDKGTQVSDHLPLLADFNWRAPHCNPLEAKTVSFTNADFSFNGRIQYPKNVQWFVINSKGTFSIYVQSNVQFEVYAAKNMSKPILDYHGEQTDWGMVYKLPEPPYFIKVFASDNDKKWTGDYAFSVHEHMCGINDPCALTPGDVEGTSTSWTQGNIASYSRWFLFYTDIGDKGTYPQLTFHLDGVCNSGLEMTLWDSNQQTVPWLSHETGNVITDVTAKHRELKPGKYFIEVSKTNQNPSGLCWAKLQFYTTLTYFYPNSLICDDETGASGTLEEAGADEIWYFFDLDAAPFGEHCDPTSSNPKNYFSKLGDFDEDDSEWMGLTHIGPLKYVSCLAPNLLEEDDIDENDVTYLGTGHHIPWLNIEVMEGSFQYFWYVSDYKYRMKYILRHEPYEKKTK